MRTIGIVAHSAEGGALCFLTATREGARILGQHMHPEIVLSAIPMGLSMPGWEGDEHDTVARELDRGVRQVADAGAEFYVCPDNTAHIVLERIAPDLPIPGLHIAHVVCREIVVRRWSRVGLLGTEWMMTGPVYEAAFERFGLERRIPGPKTRRALHRAIFDELCQGVLRPETTERFIAAIEELRIQGAECVILGCTEIPLIVNAANSPLPVVDSTRLLARYAVAEAVRHRRFRLDEGWVAV